MCSSVSSLTIIIMALISLPYVVNSIQMPENPPEESPFAYCLRTGQAGSVMACAGLAALNKLQSIQNDPSFNLVDGVTLLKDEHLTRGIDGNPFVGRDPSDFRGIFDSMATALSQRTLHWDMGTFYPGLGLRLGPSHTGIGILEFVFDPVRESLHTVKEASTARLLTRQLVIPFLMGFKFNIATLVPILFGIIAILAKKALVVSKLALVISSAAGLGSLLFGNNLGSSANAYSGSNGNYGGGYHHSPHYSNRFHQPSYFKEDVQKSSPPVPESHEEVNNHPAESIFTESRYRGAVVPSDEDPLTLSGHLENLYTKREKKTSGRNFSWNEDNIAA